MVEIGAGEVIFQSGKLDVTLLADLEQLAVVAVRAGRGWGTTPPHVHVRHGEALYVFEGELVLRLEDRVQRVGPESWAFVPPGVVHTAEVTGDSQARYLVLHTPARATATTSAETSRPSTSGRPRTPYRPIPRSSSSAGQEAWRATRSPTGQGRRATVLVEAGNHDLRVPLRARAAGSAAARPP